MHENVLSAVRHCVNAFYPALKLGDVVHLGKQPLQQFDL